MVKFSLPFFPPTTNHAFYTKHGRLHLSDKGKAFKTGVTSYLVQHHPRDMMFFKKNVPYLLYLRFYFEGGLENLGWNQFKRDGSRKSETRYKVFDATNRVKLTEDALKDAFGVDDSQFIAVCVEKCHGGPDIPEHFEAFVWDLEQERSPMDGFLRL
jgi:Holliday junction resolvase RusA-like endonuclease